MKEIKATAPTPQDWIELVRENERLKKSNAQLLDRLELAESFMSDSEWSSYMAKVENKTND
ncbi:hypothetical protein [Alteromonas phage XX1924]|nr:hypothetical protein [Alteromonas phage XX1924]